MSRLSTLPNEGPIISAFEEHEWVSENQKDIVQQYITTVVLHVVSTLYAQQPEESRVQDWNKVTLTNSTHSKKLKLWQSYTSGIPSPFESHFSLRTLRRTATPISFHTWRSPHTFCSLEETYFLASENCGWTSKRWAPHCQCSRGVTLLFIDVPNSHISWAKLARTTLRFVKKLLFFTNVPLSTHSDAEVGAHNGPLRLFPRANIKTHLLTEKQRTARPNPTTVVLRSAWESASTRYHHNSTKCYSLHFSEWYNRRECQIYPWLPTFFTINSLPNVYTYCHLYFERRLPPLT